MPTVRSQPDAARALPWSVSPLQLLAAWPARSPLACLLSGGTFGPRARWSIFAAPVETRVVDAAGTGAGADPLAMLDRSPTARASELPFAGGWIGALSYELGRVLEPKAGGGRAGGSRFPLVVMQRCPGAYIHDRRDDAWFVVGDESSLPEVDPRSASEAPGGAVEVVDAPASLMGRERFMAAVARAVEYIRAGDIFQANIAHHLRSVVRGERRAIAGRLLGAAGPWYGAYLELPDGRAVASASPELFLDYDPRTRRVMTRPIKGTRPAMGREAQRDLKDSDKDRAELTMIVDLMRNDLGRVCEFGSVVVDDPRAIERHGLGEDCSPQRTQRAQRESVGGGRGAVVGVAGLGAFSGSESGSGSDSDSDPPSVLSASSAVNSSGVYHGVATVSGVLRGGLGVADLLRATFPPGSVTGAPKIRAMQIIDELEGALRGPYCGAVGYLSDCGRSVWNVAIRTATLSGTDHAGGANSHGANAGGAIELVYPVGAGIVADSNPAHEWDETMHKAGVLMAALGLNEPRPSGSGPSA